MTGAGCAPNASRSGMRSSLCSARMTGSWMRFIRLPRASVITECHTIEVRGIPVQVVRKDIKNLHVGVYPPKGRVRVAAPLRLDDEAVRLAVITRLGWIRRQQEGFQEQDR